MNKTDRHCHKYNDEWILKNYLEYSSYKKVAQAHNELFNTDITTAAMKGHCRNKLKLNKPPKSPRWTEEEIKWLRENYPLHNLSKTTRLFNEKFNTNRTVSAIKNFGYIHNVQVEEEIANRKKLWKVHNDPNSKRCRKPAGTLRLETGRWVMKKDDGTWDQASRVVYEKNFGPIPKNYSVIFLDNDINNIDPDNLLAVPLKYLGLLSRYNLKSVSKEITLAGIEWCKLYEILKENGVIKKGDIE